MQYRLKYCHIFVLFIILIFKKYILINMWQLYLYFNKNFEALEVRMKIHIKKSILFTNKWDGISISKRKGNPVATCC